MENNRAIRLLVSVIGVSAMFGLGRLAAGAWQKRRPAATDMQMTSASNRVLIHAVPMEVYEHARRLEYFSQYLFGVDDIRVLNPSRAQIVVVEGAEEYTFALEVIADQPGDFFGLRVEKDGELYGTCLVRFEQTPGRDVGTIVSVAVKYKHEFPLATMNAIKGVVAREVEMYLSSLKDSCEQLISA